MLLCVTLELLKCIWAPVGSAKRARHLLRVLHFVLDPSLHALSMNVPPAAKLAVSEVVIFFHVHVADTAGLSSFQSHLLNFILHGLLRSLA